MKIALVRGPFFNKFEMQNYEPLPSDFEIKAFVTSRTFENHPETISIPRVILKSTEDFELTLPASFSGIKRVMLYKFMGYNFHLFSLENKIIDFDIVHSAETFHAFSYQAAKAKAGGNYKLVITQWENIPFAREDNLIRKKLKETVRRQADLFIAITKKAKDALVQEGVSPEKIIVQPMGVDIDRFSPAPADEELIKKLSIDRKKIIILFSGRLVKEKGIFELLEAAKILISESNSLKRMPFFILAGAGTEKNAVLSKISKEGLTGFIVILDKLPYNEIHKLYNICNIFVLPSKATKKWEEQFGMVLVEAMACGKPVVSTESGSIPEVIQDAGLLCQPGNAESLAEKFKPLINNESLRKELGEKARKLALERYNCKKIAESLAEIYLGLYRRSPHQ